MFLLILLSPDFALSDEACENQLILSDEIRAHIRYLASDDLRGRMSGTPGAEKAAEYISSEFKQSGLKPSGDDNSYYQNFSFIKSIVLGLDNSLTIELPDKREEYELGKDFNTLSISSSGKFKGGLVFAGYGITSKELGYDDYVGLDVKDKAVMVLRYIPGDYEPENQFYNYAALRYKAMNAREKGAKAVIFVTPYSEEEEVDISSVGLDYSYSDSGIQSLILRRNRAEEVLLKAGRNLKDLEKNLENNIPSSFNFTNSSAIVETEIIQEQGRSSNVIGIVEGADPLLKNEFIVIGAHYDHIGYGKGNSRAEKDTHDEIHNGADDNASGVAGLIELAKYFSCRKNSLKRSLIFIAFSAEELGLLGASFYVDNPKVPLERTVAMINMDMIGRLREDKLTVFGVGSSPEWNKLLQDSNTDCIFELSLNNSGFAPSDQSVFFAKEIPVLHFFTGLHKDYHTPGDDWEKTNPSGQKKVLQIISDLILNLDAKEKMIAFSNVEEPEERSSKFNVFLGTIPDYSNQIDGVKLMGVREGSPADKAGLMDDDVIVQFNSISIKNIYDYVYALSDSKAGIPTSLVVMRNNKPLSLIIIPEPKTQDSNN